MKKKSAKIAWRNLGGVAYCCICGYAINTPKELSKEHEPPLSRGGTQGGWQLAHRSCNSRKGALTAEEYAVWLALERKRNGRGG
jgi:hypothetical protein